jgi:hypothetical protein
MDQSKGKVTITSLRQFDQASQNPRGEYYRTFNSFWDARTIIDRKAADKAFHIKSFQSKHDSIMRDLAAARAAGTSIEF